MKSSNSSAVLRPVCVVLLSSILAACASSPKKQAEAPSFDSLESQAETLVTTSGPDAAIDGFEKASRADPTRKEPWVRIAQLQFDRGNYANAIMAAEEVLQRDPDDAVADGVMTVAGFRIANQSLQRLQGRGALASDTARREAQTLADTLRATMGDAILAPPRSTAKPARKRSASRSNAASGSTASSAAASSSNTATPASTPAKSSSQSNSDPFKNISGN